MDKKFYFSWCNLSAWYAERKDGKYRKNIILNEVSGTVFSKSLVAIMGASGVGKTTFLASLAGKNKEKKGLVLFNDYVIEENYLNTISNYVYQKDITIESLTVMEHMMFMSHFKLHKNPREATLTIDSILKDLNLHKCRNTLLKHLSGGERKRVSLGVELLNDPLILFCDEPTTGLDSCNALGIIQKLRERTVSERLVMVTIHQPSSQLFEYFTHAILLANGDIFYNGTTEDIATYFQSLNLHCPINYNPAEFYIKCVLNADVKNGIKAHHKNNLCIKGEIANKKKLVEYQYNKINSFASLYWLLWRSYLDSKRNFGYHTFQTCLLIATALMLAIFYSTMEDNDGHSVQNIKGILYFFTSELIFIHTYNVVNTFSEEYGVFLREKPLYSTHIYFFSKFVAIIPRNFIQPFLFLLINFSLVKFLKGFNMFFEVYAIMICACISGSMLGLCISAFFTSLEYMDLFIAPFELFTMLAAGILINVRSSIFFRWMKYLSPFYYTYESLSIIHWSRIDCLVCKNSSQICYSNGKEVLEELGFYTEPIRILWNMAYMTILSIIIAFATYLALCYKRKMHFSY